MTWMPNCTDQIPNNLGRERLMHKSDSRKFREDLKNNNSSGTESAEDSEYIKKTLLDQPLQDFEETLKSAARLKVFSAEETKDDTTKLLMDLLDNKKENKPVSYDGENLDFIDDKVEEAVIVNQGTKFAPFPGRVADEMRDLEEGIKMQRNVTCDENEQKKFMSSKSPLPHDLNVLGPASVGKVFTSFQKDPTGCDLLQRNPLVGDLDGFFKQKEELEVKVLNPPVAEVKKDEKVYTKVKGGRGSKKTKKEHVYTVEQREKTDGERSLEEILVELGEVPDPKVTTGKNKKKNKNKNKNQQQQEQKNNQQNQKQQQQKKQQNQQQQNEKGEDKKMIENPEEDKPAAPVNSKRSSSGVCGSWEDAEEEFLSADEDVGGSNSRLITPPTEFVDARTTREEGLSDVMMDPSNYRDDEEVELLAKKLLQEEDEFITVGKNNKKKKNVEQPTDKRTGSACEDRSNSRNSPQTSNNRRFSAHGGDNKPGINNVANTNTNNNNNNRRPVAPATTLADYLENTKKDTHAKKNKKPLTSTSSSSATAQQKEAQKKDDEASTFVDAVESSSPIAVTTTPNTTQAHVFSYADAAKKSSGENTPQHDMSPVPHQNNATTSANVETGGSPPSNVQLPGDFTANTPSDVTFGYDDTAEDKKRGEKKKLKKGGSIEKPDNGGVMNVGGFEFRSTPMNYPMAPSNTQTQTSRNLSENLRGYWNNFMAGPAPVVFKGKVKK